MDSGYFLQKWQLRESALRILWRNWSVQIALYMEKFEIIITQVGFNCTFKVDIVNPIPIHIIQDIQSYNPFVFNINNGLFP